jgi:hypothetical protein
MAREAKMRKYTLVVAETWGGGFDCSARVVSTYPGDIVRAALDRDPVVFHCDRTEHAYAYDIHEAVRDLASLLAHRLYNAAAQQPLIESGTVYGPGVLDGQLFDPDFDRSIPEPRNG